MKTLKSKAWWKDVGVRAVKTMAEVYATLIIKGAKTFDQVPAIIQPKVKAVLEALEVPELAEK